MGVSIAYVLVKELCKLLTSKLKVSRSARADESTMSSKKQTAELAIALRARGHVDVVRRGREAAVLRRAAAGPVRVGLRLGDALVVGVHARVGVDDAGRRGGGGGG